MGGSESRFIMGPITSSGFASPDHYMHAQHHKQGSKITLVKKNTKDRYQKFKVQETEHGTYIRFDHHPQPGIRTKKDHSVELYHHHPHRHHHAKKDRQREWGIIVLGIQDRLGEKKFVPTKQGLHWDAQHMKKTKRMRVMIYNKESKEYLRTKKGGKHTEVCTGPFEASHVKSRDDLKNYVLENGFVWEMNYVTNAPTEKQVANFVLVPVGLVANIVSVIALHCESPVLWDIAGLVGFGKRSLDMYYGGTPSDSEIAELLQAALKSAGIAFAVSGQKAFGKELGNATFLATLVSLSLGIIEDLKIDINSLQEASKEQGKKRKSPALNERPAKRAKTEE